MTILAPIQQHIDGLAAPDGYPAGAVAACLGRADQATPLLRAILQRAARGMPLGEAEAAQLFIGAHILAQLRDRQSFLPLMRLLGRPGEEVDDLFGDAISETLPRVIASVFDDDAETLFEMMADAAVDAYVRDALWRAATYLTFDGRIDRVTIRSFILRFDEERSAPKGDIAWVGWLGAIAFLGFDDLAARIGAVWIDQRLPKDVLTRRQFERDLAEALNAPEDADRFAKAGMGMIDDVTEALAWADWNGPPAPVVNPLRDVGRNDPCPCGSGKKAKKCCLAA